MKKVIIIFKLLNLMMLLHADEGMWIPLLLEKYNIEDMQEKGFRLSAEDIYNINEASLKDAVVIFGGGCTGAVVSEQGLLLTNHHCGYPYIQSHSSLSHDYLSNGFWALKRENELPNPGLSVTFLDRIEDVTKRVLSGTENALTENDRQEQIGENISAITASMGKDKYHQAVIKPFYYGNEYYMFIYKIYTDIRLVGSPPGSIGNFGKDNDNWIWPRHTGDFSIFRIYAGKDNEPADYSTGNVPYHPKKNLTISLDGYEEGDFTMVMGYPGSTSEYYTTNAVELILEKSYPQKISLRSHRLDIMDKYMKNDERVRIQYAAKYRNVSNAWKKWQGVIYGLEKVDAIEKKKKTENDFISWVNEKEERKAEFGSVLKELDSLYAEYANYLLVYEYAGEAVLAPEIMRLLVEIQSFLTVNAGKSDEDKVEAKKYFLKYIDDFFEDYYQPVDEDIYAAVLKAYHEDIDPVFHPPFYRKLYNRYDGDYYEFAFKQFKKAKFNTKKEVYDFFADYPEKEIRMNKKLLKDAVFRTFMEFSDVYSGKVNANFIQIEDEIESTYRTYIRGLMEMNKNEVLYPDANFTMRVAYGSVEGYKPRDAVIYNYETNLSGIISKYETGFADYSIPEKLLNLYKEKDYGRYADEDGQMNVCFIANNHTSGGNSGSPVMNADGELIGLNFDRNWEGTMSDLFYDKSQCRNITVDIRYILFIIEKFAGADYLIDELKIAESNS